MHTSRERNAGSISSDIDNFHKSSFLVHSHLHLAVCVLFAFLYLALQILLTWFRFSFSVILWLFLYLFFIYCQIFHYFLLSLQWKCSFDAYQLMDVLNLIQNDIHHFLYQFHLAWILRPVKIRKSINNFSIKGLLECTDIILQVVLKMVHIHFQWICE